MTAEFDTWQAANTHANSIARAIADDAAHCFDKDLGYRMTGDIWRSYAEAVAAEREAWDRYHASVQEAAS